jgi:hypothetical protein
MIKYSLFLTLLFISCVFLDISRPRKELNFTQITSLDQIIGVYKNQGDPKGYFSESIWGSDYLLGDHGKKIYHDEIDFIKVSSKNKIVLVNAIKANCIIYSRIYVYDQDFKIINGKILLKKEIHPLTRGNDDAVVGPSYELTEIGLDTEGEVKYSRKVYGAGLVYLIIPIALREDVIIKFIKINSTFTYVECND